MILGPPGEQWETVGGEGWGVKEESRDEKQERVRRRRYVDTSYKRGQTLKEAMARGSKTF